MGSGHQIVIVPYVFAPGFNSSQLANVQAALQEIENRTCVRFFVRTNQTDYIQISYNPVLGSGGLGRMGGMQKLQLNDYGSMNIDRPIHEMLHILGFHHMHQRYDRDKFITVYLNNVKPGYQYAFAKQNNRNESVGTGYDYFSILHYYKDAFSVNGKKTIWTKDRSKENIIGHVKQMSIGDALRVNRLYKCPGYTTW